MFGEEGDVVADSEARVVISVKAFLTTGTVMMGPLISDLGGVFAVSDTRAGLFITVYAATTMLAVPVAGVIADRVGRKPVIVPGVGLFGLAGAAIAFVSSFEAALALRVVQAAGAAFATPILVAAIGDMYSDTRETTAQSVRVAVDQIVGIVAPVAAGFLFVASWRYPFAVYVLALPAAGWLWVALPDLEATGEASLPAYVRDLAALVSDRVVGLLMASFVVRMVLMYGFLTYVSVLAVREAGLAVVVVGTLLAVRSFAKFVSSTQVGRLTTTQDPALVTLVGFALAGIGLITMGALPTTAVLFAGVMVYGVGDGFLSPAQKSLVNQLTRSEARAGAMSAAYTFQNVGKTAGPLGMGAILAIVGPGPAFVLLGSIGGALGTGLLYGVWWRSSSQTIS